MKIYRKVLCQIDNSVKNHPPEVGGIIGSDNGVVVTNFVMDRQMSLPSHCCSYSPNVDFLNNCIQTWITNGIYFMGIFHTHFFGIRTLSDADKVYINKIMAAMPDFVEKLYFPIYVLPNRNMECYIAVKASGGADIRDDRLEILP